MITRNRLWLIGLGAAVTLSQTACKSERTGTSNDQSPEVKLAAYEINVPLGLPEVPIPGDNPMTAEKVELGKMLYFDKRLSKDGTLSCATCHDPKLAWAENKPTSVGIEGQVGTRNSPTVLNSAYLGAQFWDGRAKDLEEQALGPIENPIEMGHTLDDMLNTLAGIKSYEKLFQQAFGSGISKENVAKAIAAFERTVLTGNSPYDQYESGKTGAMNEQQIRGMDTFMDKGQCALCHKPPTFQTTRYYNVGIGMDAEEPDVGRFKETNESRDMGAFRVPMLREAEHTAPYFHDGSVATLAEAVDIMATGGIDNEHLSAIVKGIGAAGLTDQDKADLVAFIEALSGEYPIVEEPELP